MWAPLSNHESALLIFGREKETLPLSPCTGHFFVNKRSLFRSKFSNHLGEIDPTFSQGHLSRSTRWGQPSPPSQLLLSPSLPTPQKSSLKPRGRSQNALPRAGLHPFPVTGEGCNITLHACPWPCACIFIPRVALSYRSTDVVKSLIPRPLQRLPMPLEREEWGDERFRGAGDWGLL